MAELVIVYKAIPAEVAEIVACLENRCLHPVVLDDIEKLGAYRSQTHQVRIAVPQPQREMAVGLLTQRERQDQLRLLPLLRRPRAAVLLLFAALGLFALVGLLDTRGLWFAGVGILLTLVAALALIRWAWRREPGPSPTETGSQSKHV